MTWRERVLLKLLFIVALMMTEDEQIAREIKALATHIAVVRTDEAAA